MKIMTSYGEMEESQLRKVEQQTDNEIERTTVIEYYLGPVLVHRSAHVRLKTLPSMFGDVAKIGG